MIWINSNISWKKIFITEIWNPIFKENSIQDMYENLRPDLNEILREHLGPICDLHRYVMIPSVQNTPTCV